VHPALPDVLAAVVGEWADAPRGGSAWDLFGGVGLFGAVLAGQVGPDGAVTVVESSRQAVADGRAALADLPQVVFRTGRVDQVVASLPAPDVVVADPPRKGLGAGSWTRWWRPGRSGSCTWRATRPRWPATSRWSPGAGTGSRSCGPSTRSR
jgi:hypothetical protein